MVLDIDAFRAEKGGNPDKVRENQRKRFKDVAMESWRPMKTGGKLVLMQTISTN